MPVTKSTHTWDANAAPFVREVGKLYNAQGRIIKQGQRHYTENEKLTKSQVRLTRALARKTSEQARALKAKRLGTVATKQQAKAVNDYSKSSDRMRLVTGTLQKQLGILRNQLLLVAFAYHTVQRFILQNVKAFAEFEKSLMNIEVMMTRDIAPTMQKFRKQIEGLSVTYGRSAVALSKSMFDIFSATQDAALSQKILAAATRLSVAGGAELTVTTKALVTLMEAYGGSLENAEAAATLLFQTQVISRATMGELAAEVGKFLPLGAKLNIKNQELLATYASLTRGIGDTSEAATSMRAILTALFKPSKELTKLVASWKEGTLHNIIQQKGLLYILEKLSKVETENIGKMVRRVRGLIGVSIATADLSRVIEDANEILERNLTLNELIAKQMGTTEEKLNRLKARFTIVGIHIGEFIVTWHKVILRILAMTAGLLVAAKFPAIIAGFIGMGKAIGVAGLAAGTLAGTLKLLPGLGAAAFVGWQIGGIIRELTDVDEWLQKAITGLFYLDLQKEADEAKAFSKALAMIKMQFAKNSGALRSFLRLTKSGMEAAVAFALVAKAGFDLAPIIMKSVEAMKTWRDRIRDILKDIDLEGKKTAKAMAKSFDDLFFDVMTQQFKGLAEYARQFGRAMLRMITQYLAQLAVIRAFLTPFGLPIPTGWPGAPAAHQGGVVQRYQQGGVVPILAESGEGIVSRRGMGALGSENLARLNRGEGIGGGDTYVYVIQATDALSFRDRLAQNSDIFEMTTGDAVKRNKALRAIQRMYG